MEIVSKVVNDSFIVALFDWMKDKIINYKTDGKMISAVDLKSKKVRRLFSVLGIHLDRCYNRRLSESER
jgi:hypothetical protein